MGLYAAVIATALCIAADAEADEAVERAVAVFRDHNPGEASLQLHGLIEDPGLDADTQARARYYLARSLHELGLVQSAQQELLALMAQGPEGPYSGHALSGLLAIARETGDPVALLTVVDQVEPSTQPPLVQVSLSYLQGLGAWQRGEYARADQLLGTVPQDSDLYPRARYLQGLCLLRHKKDKAAISAFEDVVEAPARGEDRRERDQRAELTALATLQVGRVYDELGNDERAEHFYAQVERGSRPWTEALEAMARIDLAQGQPASALERAVAASWPVRPAGVPRAAELLHAQALQALCRPSEARAVLRSFEDRALPLWTELSHATAAHRDDQGAWRDPEAAWATWFEDFPAASTLSTEVFEVLLAERELAEAVLRQRRLADELRLLAAQDEGWRRSMEQPLRLQLEVERSRQQAVAGVALLEAMAELEAELGVLLGLTEALRGGLTDGVGCGEAAGQQPTGDPDAWGGEEAGDEATEMSWPFTGEIWADEL